jgi:hypothetical protein
MWDGGLIKVVLLRQGRRPCHEGQVRGGTHSAMCVMAHSQGNQPGAGDRTVQQGWRCFNTRLQCLLPAGDMLGCLLTCDLVASARALHLALLVIVCTG